MRIIAVTWRQLSVVLSLIHFTPRGDHQIMLPVLQDVLMMAHASSSGAKRKGCVVPICHHNYDCYQRRSCFKRSPHNTRLTPFDTGVGHISLTVTSQQQAKIIATTHLILDWFGLFLKIVCLNPKTLIWFLRWFYCCRKLLVFAVNITYATGTNDQKICQNRKSIFVWSEPLKVDTTN